jgi:hypothetical protein
MTELEALLSLMFKIVEHPLPGDLTTLSRDADQVETQTKSQQWQFKIHAWDLLYKVCLRTQDPEIGAEELVSISKLAVTTYIPAALALSM